MLHFFVGTILIVLSACFLYLVYELENAVNEENNDE